MNELFKGDPTFKPLLASLFRLDISYYLADRAFEHVAIELNFDDEWNEYRSEFQLGKQSATADYETAFFKLVEETLCNEDEQLIKVILDFIKWTKSTVDFKEVYACLKDLEISESLLKKFATSARKLNEAKRVEPKHAAGISRDNLKIFIIHGHDAAARLELEKLLKDEFKLAPIVLQDSPGESMETIIAKFEREANSCSAAIALFTADDELKGGKLHPRLNVILELGYFLGRDQKGERRLIVLKKGLVEGPSDIHGVETINFERTISEVALKLQKQLKHWKILK